MIVNVCTAPVQVPYLGVTVMVATSGEEAALLALNEAMFPLPLAAKLIDGLSLIQSNAVAVPENEILPVAAPLQTSRSNGAVTLGVGFTVMVKL